MHTKPPLYIAAIFAIRICSRQQPLFPRLQPDFAARRASASWMDAVWILLTTKKAALPGIFAGIALVAGAASLLVRDVYAGIPAAVPVSLSATCESAASSAVCEASVVRLNPGRFRVATSGPASGLALQVGDQSATAR